MSESTSPVSAESVPGEPVSPESVSPQPVSPQSVSPQPVSPESVSSDSVSPEPVPAGPSLWLTLQAHDAPALIDFYREAFGFTVTARYDEEDGRVAHAELRWPEGTGGLMMGSHAPGREWTTQPGTAAAYVVVADPETLFQRVQAHGSARVLRPPETKDYGSTEFAVADPEGNQWSFGTYRGAAS